MSLACLGECSLNSKPVSQAKSSAPSPLLSSTMALCGMRFFSAKSITSRLRKLFRRPRRNSVRAAVTPEEGSIAADTDHASQTADPPVNEDSLSERRSTGGVLQDPPRLPPNCGSLNSEDITTPDNHPRRAGSFADTWDGYLGGTVRVVIKSYRLYSTDDPTYDSAVTRMVR